jgi:glycosyltransferase involved in cell wall biosynthesis
MRLLFVVDGRSPIALNWIEYFLQGSHEVHLVSTYDCEIDQRLASFNLVPVALSSVKRSKKASVEKGKIASRGIWSASLVNLRTFVRQWMGPLTLPGAARRLRSIINQIEPDLIHAMRIPYEGMLAALARPDATLLVSIWGNDFTLHAPSTPLMSYFTRMTLQRADALHADCHRDVALASEWGFGKQRAKPTKVLPGAGGIQPDVFYPVDQQDIHSEVLEAGWTVVNPRGFRAYVRNDVFFKAIPNVIEQNPNVRFVCPNMADEPRAHDWLDKLGISEAVDLLPRLTRDEMAGLFRRSQVVVSPSVHDGTPNTLLEAMACGCFPVAGDLESIREWITSGKNGILVNPEDPQALGQAILAALDDKEFRKRAQNFNLRQVEEKASYSVVMKTAQEYYQLLIG